MVQAENPQMGKTVHPQMGTEPLLDTLRESNQILMEGSKALHTSSTQDHAPQMEVIRQECTNSTLAHTP